VNILFRSLWAAALLGAAASSAAAQELPVPALRSVFPCGAKQGATVEVDIGGTNLDEAKELYFSNPGIHAELISKLGKGVPRFKVTVDPKVPLGDYDVRVIGKLGISNPRAFAIGDLEEVNEKEPNNSREIANRVPMNCVINGKVDPSEDVDWFVFPAKKGQRVLIECRAWRLDSRLDGMMTLYSSAGKELVTSQDENIRDQKRDPFIDFDVPEDGDYYLKFSDFMYNGSPEHVYRLSIGTEPYLDFITPTGAKPGTTVPITFYGRNLPGGEKTDIKVNGRPLEKVVQNVTVPADPEAVTDMRFHELLRPTESRLDGMEVRVHGDTGASNARLLLFSDFPQVMEVEPNDQHDQAQRIEVPCCVTGAFSAPKDIDHYVFSAKKGEKFTIEVDSERLGSPADPDMEISEKDEKIINSFQDTGENIGQLRFYTPTRDIVYDFVAPKDADFYVRLEHAYQQVQGGPQYQYRLQIQKDAQPDFRLACVPAHDIHLDNPVVYQGGRQRMDILVWRMNGLNEPITVEAKNLPQGVTAEPIVIGPDMKMGVLVVTAAPDAPICEKEIEVVGTSQLQDGKTLTRKARGGTIVWDTTNTPAISRVTRSIMLAVREKTPFSVTASSTATTIKQGDPIPVTVTATRREDMPSAIQLSGAIIDLPVGMTIPTTNINTGQTEAKLSIATTDKLKPGAYSFVINSESQVPNGTDKKTRVIYPSNPIKIIVEPKAAK